MANAGIKSSQAGTAMRSMMTNLTGEVKFVGDAFGELTIQTTNTDGSMRSLGDILADCRAAFSQMSESEKAANAEALVGKNAMSGFLAVMNAAPGDIEKLNSAINNCDGTAEKMAATMQDNLAGQLTIRYTAGSNFTCSNLTEAKAVAERTYEAAVELFAMLCKKYSLNPLADGVVISHKEGYSRGIASNHGDPEHLWAQLGTGYTMDGFRRAVKAAMGGASSGGSGTDGYTKIMGNAATTAEQMKNYIKAKNPKVAQSVLDMVPLYLSEGRAEGVRGDIAFAQSCLETGNFTFSGSAVTLSQNNFCGMGVTANGMKGNSFDTSQLGIRAQVQHLKAYASTDALKNACIDPRFKYVTRGCAEYVEWLGQKENPDGKGWAAGAGYGEKILAILKGILGMDGGASSGSAGAEVWYRVRKSWADASSQKGAFKSLEIAKKCADENPGYSVFDESGNAVYTGAAFQPYLVRVSIPDLNIRKGPGTDHAKTGKYTNIGTFTIVDEADGKGASKWGLLKSYEGGRDGWISLDHASRV